MTDPTDADAEDEDEATAALADPPGESPAGAPALPAPVPPKPAAVRAACVARAVAIAGLFALGIWLAYGGFTEAGLAVLLLAITQLGNTVEMTADQRRTLELVARSVALGAATAHGVAKVREGVDDIRNNPGMPGTPTASAGGEGDHDAAG